MKLTTQSSAVCCSDQSKKRSTTRLKERASVTFPHIEVDRWAVEDRRHFEHDLFDEWHPMVVVCLIFEYIGVAPLRLASRSSTTHASIFRCASIPPSVPARSVGLQRRCCEAQGVASYCRTRSMGRAAETRLQRCAATTRVRAACLGATATRRLRRSPLSTRHCMPMTESTVML